MNRRQSRLLSEQKIIEAVGQVIAEKGMRGLGINEISRCAGLDKVLIYRYFGGLPGLLRRFGESAQFWPTFREIFHTVPQKITQKNARSAAKKIFLNFYNGFRKRPLTLDILAYECVGRNELTESLEEVREIRGKQVFDELAKRGLNLNENNALCASILSAAIQYLAIRARDIKIFGPIRLDSTQGWNAIAETMAFAIDKLTDWD